MIKITTNDKSISLDNGNSKKVISKGLLNYIIYPEMIYFYELYPYNNIFDKYENITVNDTQLTFENAHEILDCIFNDGNWNAIVW